MALEGNESRRWADLCDQHEAAKKAVDEAFPVVQDKFLGIGTGKGFSNPTAEDLTRLEDARANREAIEPQMDEFITTRR
jgi:hypothetical protein